MSLDRAKIAGLLNGLITVCKDSQEAYDQAADDVNEAQHKALFKEYSNQRLQFISQLQNQIQLLGEQVPANEGSVMGEIHQAWMGLKAVLTSGNLHALLSELEHGEDADVAAYQKALKENLPETTREVVQQQYEQVKMAHDRIKAIRDAVKKS